MDEIKPRRIYIRAEKKEKKAEEETIIAQPKNGIAFQQDFSKLKEKRYRVTTDILWSPRFRERWVFARDLIWKNLGKVCLKCRKDTKLIEVDHIVPVSVNDKILFNAHNLQPLCKHCNIEKGIETIDYRSKYNKTEINRMLRRLRVEFNSTYPFIKTYNVLKSFNLLRSSKKKKRMLGKKRRICLDP